MTTTYQIYKANRDTYWQHRALTTDKSYSTWVDIGNYAIRTKVITEPGRYFILNTTGGGGGLIEVTDSGLTAREA